MQLICRDAEASKRTTKCDVCSIVPKQQADRIFEVFEKGGWLLDGGDHNEMSPHGKSILGGNTLRIQRLRMSGASNRSSSQSALAAAR